MRAFVLTNVSSTACAVQGWPAVKLVLQSGQVISPSVRLFHYDSSGAPNHVLQPRAITLQPRSVATFLLFDQDWNYKANKACARIRAMLVTPPGADTRLVVPKGLGQYCAPLNVGPLVPGLSPRYP